MTLSNPHSHNANQGQQPAWTTKDLFELASLDALGLLSDDERRCFEEAFVAASPAVQEQLRDQQTRMAEIDAILPRVEPPASLRDRVLAAVAAAIGTGSLRTAAGALSGAARVHAGGRHEPRLLPSRGVSPLWRGIAIGCVAGMIALSVVAAQVFMQNREIDQAMTNNVKSAALLREYGPKFQRDLLDPRTRFVSFTPADVNATLPSRAVLLLNPEAKTGQFYCADLPSVDGSFSLVIVGPDGKALGTAVATFSHSGSGLVQQDVANLDLSGGKSLALVAQGAGVRGQTTLLRSTTH